MIDRHVLLGKSPVAEFGLRPECLGILEPLDVEVENDLHLLRGRLGHPAPPLALHVEHHRSAVARGNVLVEPGLELLQIRRGVGHVAVVVHPAAVGVGQGRDVVIPVEGPGPPSLFEFDSQGRTMLIPRQRVVVDPVEQHGIRPGVHGFRRQIGVGNLRCVRTLVRGDGLDRLPPEHDDLADVGHVDLAVAVHVLRAFAEPVHGSDDLKQVEDVDGGVRMDVRVLGSHLAGGVVVDAEQSDSDHGGDLGAVLHAVHLVVLRESEGFDRVEAVRPRWFLART